MGVWLMGQIPLIVWLQSMGPWLSLPMQALTWLGSAQVLLIAVLALTWCVDARLGLRLGLILVASTGINSALKLAFGLPRPTWTTRSVRPLAAESTFGFPSGHAQNGLVFWGRLAAWVGRPGLWALSFAIVLLVSLSRIVLGVHYSMDILGGWLIGALVLGAFMLLEGPADRWLSRHGDRLRLLAALLASLLLLLLNVVIWTLTAGRLVPADWLLTASITLPPQQIDPRSLQTAFQVSGLLFGLAAGGVMLDRGGRFSAAGAWTKRVLRYLAGLAGLVIIYLGPRLVLPHGEAAVALMATYLHHALVGLWIAWLGPLAFVAVKVASPLESSRMPPSAPAAQGA